MVFKPGTAYVIILLIDGEGYSGLLQPDRRDYAALAGAKLDPIAVATLVPAGQGSGADVDTSAVRNLGF